LKQPETLIVDVRARIERWIAGGSCKDRIDRSGDEKTVSGARFVCDDALEPIPLARNSGPASQKASDRTRDKGEIDHDAKSGGTAG
jgi:hypothetical protein